MTAWMTPFDGDDNYMPHKCGKCANPFTGGRADCRNAPRLTTIAAPMTQDDVDREFNLIASGL
jgi:hypothetical protein